MKPHKHWTFLQLPAAFSGSQASTSSRRSYMKHSLRVNITIIFSSIQLHLSLHYDIFANPASTYTYYRPFILFHQSKVTETKDVNKDLTSKDQDKDKDLTPKDQDKDKYLSPKSQHKDLLDLTPK